MPKTEPQKIRARLRSHERKLRLEKKKSGDYSDGAGKRYEIGPLYMLLDDDAEAVAAFEWFEREFDDDVGRPDPLLCIQATKLRVAVLGRVLAPATMSAGKGWQREVSLAFGLDGCSPLSLSRAGVWGRRGAEF